MKSGSQRLYVATVKCGECQTRRDRKNYRKIRHVMSLFPYSAGTWKNFSPIVIFHIFYTFQPGGYPACGSNDARLRKLTRPAANNTPWLRLS